SRRRGRVAVEGRRLRISQTVVTSMSGRVASRTIKSGSWRRAFFTSSKPEVANRTRQPVSAKLVESDGKRSVAQATNNRRDFIRATIAAQNAVGQRRHGNKEVTFAGR